MRRCFCEQRDEVVHLPWLLAKPKSLESWSAAVCIAARLSDVFVGIVGMGVCVRAQMGAAKIELLDNLELHKSRSRTFRAAPFDL